MSSNGLVRSYLVTSIQVGRPRTFNGPDGKAWRSAIAKEPVLVPLALGPEGLEGDSQVDRRYHGGPERAVLGYCEDHYAEWRQELSAPGLGPGSFGENFTITVLSE